MLLILSAEDFFEIYSERESYEEIPLLTNDGIVIPKIGLKNHFLINESCKYCSNNCRFKS